MSRIIFKEKSFDFEQIKEGLRDDSDELLLKVLDFCGEWLNGKESFIFPTSGSTGTPKKITLLRIQMETSVHNTALALGLIPGDKALVCLNTSYIAGIMMLVRGMVVGMDLFLVPPASSPLKGLPKNSSLDFTAMVPLQLHSILSEKEPAEIAVLEGMKGILIGGAPISAELEEKIQLLSVPVYSTYGMTETVSHIALRKLNGPDKQDYYQTLPGVLIALDERGCLKIAAPMTLDQWLQTNDVVEMIEPTKFRWVGRADHTINSGGIKIQPEKMEARIENVLQKNGIQKFFIAGLPHPTLGEAVSLFIEGKKQDNQSLIEQLHPYLDKYEIPKAIITVNSFTQTSTGKTDRLKITDPFKSHYFSREDQ